MDDFTRSLLSNPEVLAVNQDPLGRQARRIHFDARTEIWSRTLADGSLAVGLFNRGRGVETITLEWQMIGLSGAQRVRNLWQRTDEGVATVSLSRIVARHGAVLLRLIPSR
jgi:alpha-galactosidase